MLFVFLICPARRESGESKGMVSSSIANFFPGQVMTTSGRAEVGSVSGGIELILTSSDGRSP